jgi:hypothetical protein
MQRSRSSIKVWLKAFFSSLVQMADVVGEDWRLRFRLRKLTSWNLCLYTLRQAGKGDGIYTVRHGKRMLTCMDNSKAIKFEAIECRAH